MPITKARQPRLSLSASSTHVHLGSQAKSAAAAVAAAAGEVRRHELPRRLQRRRTGCRSVSDPTARQSRGARAHQQLRAGGSWTDKQAPRYWARLRGGRWRGCPLGRRQVVVDGGPDGRTNAQVLVRRLRQGLWEKLTSEGAHQNTHGRKTLLVYLG